MGYSPNASPPQDSKSITQLGGTPQDFEVGLRISYPLLDEYFDAHDGNIPVATEALPGFTIDKVLVVTPFGAEEVLTATSGSFEVFIPLPIEAFGEYPIQAFGMDVAGTIYKSQVVTISVVENHTCTLLFFSPPEQQSQPIELSSLDREAQMIVLGLGDDGIVRDFTSSSTGTFYTSDDISVCTVSADGVITAVGNGSATVLALHSGEGLCGFSLGTGVQVEVLFDPCPTDVDGDRRVSVVDLLALLAAWGECPAVCMTDFDGDGSVNVTDLLALLSSWGPCP